MRRRAASVATLDAPASADQKAADPAPVDAESASQPAMVEAVAAAVVETVIAATIEPTLPASDALVEKADPADALEVTVVEEHRSDDVAVILQSADSDAATTPVSLPTSPITLPVSRRSRRRPVADAVIIDSAVDASVADSEPVETPDAAEPEVAASVSAPADDVADEFASAARLFAFTGETPTQQAAPVAPAAEPVSEGLPAAAAPRSRRTARRIAATSFSVGVMGVVGLLTVGMTMPVSALASAAGTDNVAAPEVATTRLAVAGDVAASGANDIQAYVAPAQAQSAAVDRADDGYSATTYTKMALDSGITRPSDFYTNDPTAPIQWPFAVGVSISYGFGMRDGGFHEGADFVPGEGSPVQAIADGTVRIATEQGGAFGVTVLIDHEIDGQLVSSRYGHMQYGSLQVTQGEKVHVGQFLGRTGNTGRSFGAHTHVEILQNGTTPIDPIAWLRQHAGG
ncbi:peptidoglycan DD-metalloendopeptidase family protein [Microbacterium sp. JC 701]|uniref:Peptidoglycan DD-metalloendopeptidase family protein n=1 Tax=Microbacterium algihabitans TaxID=3075992 RepID=A0ABU3RXJ7_9MICO|nr:MULTISPECIES: peptidoglycan DD-metalloendopeptidase family protein [unclassified Microbacterium]MCD2170611.1 peptidoglycan DD-metalloendopeptidase family protein [Microbacterium sp. JC 701]MDU0327188.1 peptidoglycan DD-metalloendopeptidase family protein [Microbacterium sp. KSW2-21]